MLLPGLNERQNSLIVRPVSDKTILIQLDDLIPKKDVRGGRQLLFGAADTQQPTHIEKE
jgi:hypothetical protein